MSAWMALLTWALMASALHLRGRRQLVRAARAGHEIRGPLCTAQLALEGLERSARVEAIRLELRRAALALDELAGAPRREAVAVVDVGRLLAEAEGGWHALAEAHGVTLTVEPGGGRVLGDRLRLAQACANLVANAIEHGAASAPRHEPHLRLFGGDELVPGALVDPDPLETAARLDVDGLESAPLLDTDGLETAALLDTDGLVPAARLDMDGLVPAALVDGHESWLVRVRSWTADGRVRVAVEDSGPGLPAPVAELVAAARGRRSPRGHGLAIAAAVAERHGGRLSSLPAGRGARLVLELPEAP